MNRPSPRLHLLASALCALAGFVDAIGYLQLHGLFVSFMSGNSTRLGIAMVEDRRSAGLAAALVAFFVAGVIVGTVAARATGAWRSTAVLLVVALLLAAGAVSGTHDAPLAAIACMTLAMGAQNLAFERGGRVTIGLTYLTGALVRVGEQLVDAVAGGDRWGWIGPTLLWCGLVGGAIVGAAVYPTFALGALWFAAAAAMLMAIAARTVADEAAPKR